MSRLFLDTNVILDLLAERHPFYNSIAKIATLADQKKLILVASPLSFTTVEYVLRKFESSESVLNKLRKFKTKINSTSLMMKVLVMMVALTL